jgi:hypothetical protein
MYSIDSVDILQVVKLPNAESCCQIPWLSPQALQLVCHLNSSTKTQYAPDNQSYISRHSDVCMSSFLHAKAAQIHYIEMKGVQQQRHARPFTGVARVGGPKKNNLPSISTLASLPPMHTSAFVGMAAGADWCFLAET